MPAAKVRKTARRKTPAPGIGHVIGGLPTSVRQTAAGNRRELQKAVAGVRKEVESRAARFIRDAERKLLKQMHAATEGQVRRLERRVARLERLVGG